MHAACAVPFFLLRLVPQTDALSFPFHPSSASKGGNIRRKDRDKGGKVGCDVQKLIECK